MLQSSQRVVPTMRTTRRRFRVVAEIFIPDLRVQKFTADGQKKVVTGIMRF
jgi:hypothetical protein